MTLLRLARQYFCSPRQLHLHRTIQQTKNCGKKPESFSTSTRSSPRRVLTEVDVISPRASIGFGGQSFIEVRREMAYVVSGYTFSYAESKSMAVLICGQRRVSLVLENHVGGGLAVSHAQGGPVQACKNCEYHKQLIDHFNNATLRSETTADGRWEALISSGRRQRCASFLNGEVVSHESALPRS
jgi:hypothetical protein